MELNAEKQRPWRNGRGLSFMLVVGLTLAILNPAYSGPAGTSKSRYSDREGYLPRVGPVGLRFLPEPIPFTNNFALPVPPEPEPEPVVEKPEPPAPVVVAKPEPPTTNEVSTAPIVQEPTRSEEVVSPQMLLRYFNRGTNGTSTTVIAPLEFSPPRPVETPPSKATFEVGP